MLFYAARDHGLTQLPRGVEAVPCMVLRGASHDRRDDLDDLPLCVLLAVQQDDSVQRSTHPSAP